MICYKKKGATYGGHKGGYGISCGSDYVISQLCDYKPKPVYV